MNPGWAWRPNLQTRVAIRRGEAKYTEWRKELAERAAAERREFMARRAES